MNKKIHWEKISVLVVVLVGVVVILLVMGKKAGSFDNFITSAPSQTDTLEEKKGVLPVENVYVNERYGFQMTLPNSWKKEKTYTKDVIIGGMDSDYPGIELGYAFDQEVEAWGQIGYLYGIYIIPHDEWKKKVDQSIMVKLGENNEYVFAFIPENDLFRNVGCGDVNVDPFVPQQQQEFCTSYADLKNILNTKAIDKLNFSTTDVNVAWDAENTYTDSLVGYSFSYPQEWRRYVNETYSTFFDWGDNRVISEVQVGNPVITYIQGQVLGDFLTNTSSGPAMGVSVEYDSQFNHSIEQVVASYYPDDQTNRPVATDFTIDGARVYKYTLCVQQIDCAKNDPSIVYIEDYIFVPKPGYAYSIRTAVTLSDSERRDEQKKKVLIEKSIQQFEGIIKSFQMKK